MFEYTTSDGFEFSSSVPLSGGQAQIDMIGNLFRNAIDNNNKSGDDAK